MSKAGTGIAAPIGFKFDKEATLVDNAKGAWDAHLTMVRNQYEHNAKVLARRVFKTDDLQFAYETFSPQTPTFDVEDEKVAFYEGKFALVEMCPDCLNHWQLRPFSSLAGFGGAIEARDDSPEEFVCRDCRFIASLKGQKS